MSSMKSRVTNLVVLWVAVTFLSSQIVLLSGWCPRFYQRIKGLQGRKCQSLLHSGRWAGDGVHSPLSWLPYDSMIHNYTAADLIQCPGNRSLYFVGDSSARQIFEEASAKLGLVHGNASNELPQHADIHYRAEQTSIHFLWDPYLNKSNTIYLFQTALSGDTAGIFFGAGLWHARYGGAEELEILSTTFGQIHPRNTDTTLVAIPPPHIAYEHLNAGRSSTITPERVTRIITELAKAEEELGLEVAWAMREMTRNMSDTMKHDGLHVTSTIAAKQADILLNRACNGELFQNTDKEQAMACTNIARNIFFTPLSMAVMLFVPLSVVLLIALTALAYRGENFIQAPLSLLIFIAVVLYCWCTDRGPLFSKADKPVSEMCFALSATIIVGAIFGVSEYTRNDIRTLLPRYYVDKTDEVKKGGGRDQFTILPRAQTEEWKGWMQIIILLYHYFGMSKMLWVYQIVRLLVAAYLFLTAYGHATYFYTKHDFSCSRAATVLLRLNMLPCCLALVMNNQYDFYYFPGLASLWFIIVYLTFWRRSEFRDMRPSAVFTLLRIALSASVLRTILNHASLFTDFSSAQRWKYGPLFNGPELLFRVELDWLVPFFGMALAVLQPSIQKTMLNMPHEMLLATGKKLQVIWVTVAICLIWGWFQLAKSSKDKYEYNAWHARISIMPVVAYIIVRNLTVSLRSRASSLFAWVGACSLELFVLQYHIWLAADTKGLLRLHLIDTPKFNTSQTVLGSWTWWAETIVVSIVFVWLSHILASASNVLVNCLVKGSSNFEKRVFRDRTLLIRMCAVVAAIWLLNVLSVHDV